ncbi:MAG: DUF1844 domain-containing protein [Desulfarculaceae bacterium]|nr:DUF1844 domain-containing protein [Desulfarculaceae bacterium]MCF8047596.1 DUF1844 domain-containing protein [Desulfarculaceae bacterium]MCF8099537.1 DUF1844 domain-containing protein [Desulfarculaceae bacterium]MCF8123417.1 DUF1844 domain-containing protein [Desulfarculaceae bacterium]
MSEQEKGFTVKDRRRFDSSGETRNGAEPEQEKAPEQKPQPEPQPEPQAPPQEPVLEAEPQEQQAGGPGPQAERRHQLPPVDFSGLILSLAHATMMHLGQIPGPDGQPMPPELDLARHTIDTIAMLQAKTKGNLDPEEQKLIDTALVELRMAFVQIAG